MKTCAVPGAQPPCQEGGREHQEHWTGANECTRCWRKGQRRGQSDSVGVRIMEGLLEDVAFEMCLDG